MDGNAPYTLQELSTFGDNDPTPIGDNEFYHVATGDIVPGFVEVSAVYSNEISAAVTSADVQNALMDYPSVDSAVVSYDFYDLGRIAQIIKISQSDYSDLSSQGVTDDSTLYVIV